MILADQFTNLPADLLFVFSSREDGSVLDRTIETYAPHLVESRKQICVQAGISYDDVVFQRVIYDEAATYSLIAEVDTRSTTTYTTEVVADALFTRQPGVGLFLPVADCIVTVIYDPLQRLLAQLHMGRHSTLSDLLPRMLTKFVSEGSAVSDLRVWMAPAATKQTYKLEYFEQESDPRWTSYVEKKSDGYYLDMQGYNTQVCLDAGVLESNITISAIDTVINKRYFSHSRGDTSERFAGLAMMR